MDIIKNNIGYRHTFTEEPIEQVFTEDYIGKLCKRLNLIIVTTHKELAIDLNNFYCGYKLHKKTYKNHRNTSIASLKAVNDKRYDVFKYTYKLLLELKSLPDYKGGGMLEDLNNELSIVQKKELNDSWTTRDIIEKLEILKKTTEKKLLFTGSENYESSSKEWFIGKAIPLIFGHHTERSHTRSYSAGTGSCGVPHIFTKEILSLLGDFSDMSDSAIDSAMVNYKKNLEKNSGKIANGDVSLYIFPPEPLDFSDIMQTVETQLK